jgi:hypothetical protein
MPVNFTFFYLSLNKVNPFSSVSHLILLPHPMHAIEKQERETRSEAAQVQQPNQSHCYSDRPQITYRCEVL